MMMKIRKSVYSAMGKLNVEALRKHQLKPINSILNGNDTMVIAPTSFGKSLIYQIPAIINKNALTVVIEPLLALMHDQVNKLKQHGISAEYLDSTLPPRESQLIKVRTYLGKVNILYISPERLETGILSAISQYQKIGMIVVDECHCVTSWGNTFRKAYLDIGQYINELPYHPVIVALSASAPPEDRPEIMNLLSMQHAQCFQISLYRSNLSFAKTAVSSRKAQRKQLMKFMRKYHKHTTIVFCNTKKAAEYVAKKLKEKYPNDVLLYHSKSKHNDRNLLSGKQHIIVATTALSMGVDIPNVDLVIHFNLPLSIPDYYQMSGRAGREDQHARSILLYNRDDYFGNYSLLQQIDDSQSRKNAIAKLDAMRALAEDDKHCMVRQMLQSLGDAHEKDCRYCTNCQKERKGQKAR